MPKSREIGPKEREMAGRSDHFSRRQVLVFRRLDGGGGGVALDDERAPRSGAGAVSDAATPRCSVVVGHGARGRG